MQFRSTTAPRVSIPEIIVVFYALAAGTLTSDPPAALLERTTFIRLAIPTIAIAVALLLRNASRRRSQAAALVDIAVGFATAIASQLALSVLKPELLLPHYRFTRGALIAWMFLTALRAWFPHRYKVSRELEAQVPLTIEKLRWNAIEFEIKAREWSSRGKLAAVAAIGLLALGLPFAGTSQILLVSVIFIAGAAYVTWIIHRRGLPAAAPLGGGRKDFAHYCHTELHRQSVLLHRMWHWYFGSLIPGVLLLLQGSTLYGYFGLIYVLLIGELNYQAIEWLHLQMTRLADEISRVDNDNSSALMSKRPSIYGEHGRL